jgi:hypothetical protein
MWGISDAPTGVSVFRRFNIGRGNFISSFSLKRKPEPSFGKINYCTEGRDNKGFLHYRSTDKVDVQYASQFLQTLTRNIRIWLKKQNIT